MRHEQLYRPKSLTYPAPLVAKDYRDHLGNLESALMEFEASHSAQRVRRTYRKLDALITAGTAISVIAKKLRVSRLLVVAYSRKRFSRTGGAI